MSPRAYAIMHRMHHAYTDTEKDPHSPRYSKNVYDMMMRTNKIYMGAYNGTLQVDEKFARIKTNTNVKERKSKWPYTRLFIRAKFFPEQFNKNDFCHLLI